MAAGRMDRSGTTLRRIRIRSRQRGLKETCFLLGNYADNCLDHGDDQGMEVFEQLLGNSDQEILAWVLGLENPPDDLAGLVERIRIDSHRESNKDVKEQ